MWVPNRFAWPSMAAIKLESEKERERERYWLESPATDSERNKPPACMCQTDANSRCSTFFSLASLLTYSVSDFLEMVTLIDELIADAVFLCCQSHHLIAEAMKIVAITISVVAVWAKAARENRCNFGRMSNLDTCYLPFPLSECVCAQFTGISSASQSWIRK